MTLLKAELRAQFYRQVMGGNAPHALLLTGAERQQLLIFGRDFAAALLCAELSLEGACGNCLRCRLLAEGNQPDFRFLEKGKERVIKVERIRSEIISEIYVSSQYGERKVYLIMADDLNEQGQNILLKSLEEPPPGVYFILLAERKWQLLPTVLSRLVEIPLNLAPSKVSEASTGPDYSKLHELFFTLPTASRADLLLEGLDYLLSEKDQLPDFFNEIQKLLRDLAFLLTNPNLSSEQLALPEEYKRSKALASKMQQQETRAIFLINESIKATVEVEEALSLNSSMEVSLGQYLLALRRNFAEAVRPGSSR